MDTYVHTQEHNLLAFKVKILVHVCMDLQIGYCSSKKITQKVSTLKASSADQLTKALAVNVLSADT